MKLRDLNFRVWDSSKGKYHYPSKRGKNGKPSVVNMSFDLDDEIELYTKEYDYNEKEICEGDILKHIHYPTQYVVVYDKLDRAFYLVPIDNEEEERMAMDNYFIDNYKIIGNVHKNKLK